MNEDSAPHGSRDTGSVDHRNSPIGIIIRLGEVERVLNEGIKANKEANDQLSRDVHAQLRELTPSPYRIVAIGAALVAFLIVPIWNASRYPDRTEYERLAARVETIEMNWTARVAAAPITFVLRAEFKDVADRLSAIEYKLPHVMPAP